MGIFPLRALITGVFCQNQLGAVANQIHQMSCLKTCRHRQEIHIKFTVHQGNVLSKINHVHNNYNHVQNT